MCEVTAHMVYFCAFARSEIFPKNARKYGVGRGQFDAGVNGVTGQKTFHYRAVNIWNNLNNNASYALMFSLIVLGISLEGHLKTNLRGRNDTLNNL